jgi:hypothetical protein
VFAAFTYYVLLSTLRYVLTRLCEVFRRIVDPNLPSVNLLLKRYLYTYLVQYNLTKLLATSQAKAIAMNSPQYFA